MSRDPWNDDISYEFVLYRMILWPLGIWPLNRHKIISDIRLVVVALTQATTSICLTTEILLNCRGLEDALDIFVLDVFASLAFYKGIIVRFHQEDVYSNVLSAVQDWTGSFLAENTKFREIMIAHARIGRIVCFSLMGPASCATLSWIFNALPLSFLNPNSTETVRNFPLQTACTFEAIVSINIVYHIIFVLQAVQLVTTCLGNCGNDCFFFGIAMHVCGQFEILKEQFAAIGRGLDEDEKTARKRLVHLSRRHSHLVEVAAKLENTFQLIILYHLAMTAILICIMAIQLLIGLKTGDAFTGIKASGVLCALMSQLFVYSYGGDYLTLQNEELANAIYHSLWYNFSPGTVKDFIFVMMRSGKPIHITAGKFFIMTLGTFMDIIKISVSYISVLRVMVDV